MANNNTMEIEKLSKEDFTDPFLNKPTVRFTHDGVIYFNKAAVRHLGLYDKQKDAYSCVEICRDSEEKSDFAIFKNADGWQLRKEREGAVFNSRGLARHVIDATWERCVSHPVDAVKPCSVVFRIARLPLDDGKNKDVYALLRKHE